MEVTSPPAILIDYSPFVCASGRPCAGCLDYHERKRQAVEAATALKNRGTRSPVASNRSRSPLLVGSEDEDGEEEGQQGEGEADSDEVEGDQEEEDADSDKAEAKQGKEGGDFDDNNSDSSPLTPV